ncbi:ABC transporter permease [Vibrio panuliri]|uniref:ABC transporter permease n=1 Tax=Vibrio panuliri TaxID=1381081 RepID=A0ABX3FHW7_9VIBR|nr:FtsX-like permease family protein [Vibrio panuliri]KAB1454605.1 ABC transporter permease [Vibrio panuliri]OLQ90753.1 ABC transporter permease [Vibrio panuliri]
MAANKHSSMLLTLVSRSLRLRAQRVLVVFMALTVGAAIITAMAGVYFDINQKMSYELRNYGANFFVGPDATTHLDTEQYNQIKSLAPKDSLIASSPYLYGMVQAELEKIVLMGIDFSQLQKLVPYWQVEGGWVGVSFDDRNVMIGKKLAEKLELKVGSSLTVYNKNERYTFKIKGIVESGADEDNYLIVNLPFVQKWLNKGNEINFAMFSLTNDKGQVSQFESILKQQHPDLLVRPIRKVSASEGKVLNKIKLLMGIVALVILVLSTLCVNTTMTSMISERRYEFALQKSLGASNQSITRQIVLETIAITCAAVIAGLVIGYVLAQFLGQSVFNATIDLRLPVLVITSLLSFAAALVAATLPTIRAIRIDPAKVLKGD